MSRDTSLIGVPAVRLPSPCRWWKGLTTAALCIIGLGVHPGIGLACVGDCDGDGAIAINELIAGVGIALGNGALSTCAAFDCQGNGSVPISCLIQGVNGALNGCEGGPTVALTGSCVAPGNGSRGLAACETGTPITVFRCDDRSQCLHGQGRTMLGATSVASGGVWSVPIPAEDADAPLIVEATITTGVVYRALVFAGGAALQPGLARAATFAPAAVTPVSEAGVALLDGEGFANYSDAGARQVLQAVEQATAELSFVGNTPEMASAAALQTASADATVMTVLQSARNTPVPTETATNAPTDVPTATATSAPTDVPTATATPLPGRFVDNGDGTITDGQTGLTWEKKDYGGGLHHYFSEYYWSGNCTDHSGICQPNAAAEATCNAATGGGVRGCAQCPGTATCYTFSTTTIWDWVNQLNAANFAGHSDWRIPSVGRDGGMEELETIRDLSIAGCGTGRPCVAPEFNKNCLNGCTVTNCSCTEATSYWSAIPDTGAPDAAWVLSFYGGDFNYARPPMPVTTDVRAVRGP